MAEATPGARPRPLSPHVMHWRWHITMAASILTRVTGVGSYIGLLLVAGWALALASGEEAYETFTGLLGSIPGQVVLFGFTVSVFYHLAAGVRHLAWDLGMGYEKSAANASAWAAILFAIVASLAVWALFLLGAP
ncbi:MAG TPA: succinate dehydrogenase, cytochrome b556 subunit [Caulobacteraceae bacterium]|nr:succinate dehydrogenase, cytochrome b556 subunit [Caulobacteraceae bacterium]